MAYTRMYIAVSDADAEVVSALGAIRVTSEEMKNHRMLSGMRLAPGVSAWYYVDKNPNLFVKWPFITFEFVPESDEITEEDEFESTDAVSLLDDDYDHEIDYDDNNGD